MMLTNKRAVVTGGNRGIGRSIALRLAADGADLALAARDRASLESTAAEVRALGRKALAVVADVSREEDVEALVARTRSELGGIDILVNNAGIIGPTTPITQLARKD